jgi:putative membrane protein
MKLFAEILIGLVAFLHLYFLWLEMFAWTTSGPKTFKKPIEYFKATKSMAANQGLYNGFLAAGLIWSLVIVDPEWQFRVAVFFLSCVFVAGIYGAVSVQKSIFFIQALPAGIALSMLSFI